MTLMLRQVNKRVWTVEKALYHTYKTHSFINEVATAGLEHGIDRRKTTNSNAIAPRTRGVQRTQQGSQRAYHWSEQIDGAPGHGVTL